MSLPADKHDPVFDPRPGDTLVETRHCIDGVRRFHRTVLSVHPRPLRPDCPWIRYTTRSGERVCQISEWTQWAKRAKVIEAPA
jgi:hypothetical protein